VIEITKMNALLTRAEALLLREQILRNAELAAAGPEAESTTELVKIVSADEFAAVDEPNAEALVSVAGGGAAYPAAGLVVYYGDGGAGKTTLLVDQSLHFAAGEAWLDLLEPARPLTVLLIENDGPRPEFRRKLRDRLAGWNGAELSGRLKILTEPWGRVTLRDERQRQQLAQLLDEHTVDLVIAGPLASLGMVGAGNLEDVHSFASLIADVRNRSSRQVAFVVVHHESKAGQVSGAWEPLPDTLVHVQPQGHGKLRVHWQKVRWASSLHKKTSHLAWAEGATFTLEEREPITAERVWAAIAAYVREHGGCAWNKVDDAVSGKGELKRETRARMLADGVLVDAGGSRGGMALWHRDDPLRPEGDAVGDAVNGATGDAGSDATASLRPDGSRNAGGTQSLPPRPPSLEDVLTDEEAER
jgi:AAA domain